MKATEQFFPVVLFIMLYKAVPTFESVTEILKCDHSNESYWVVLPCGAVYYAADKVVLTFESVDKILKYDHSNERSSGVLPCDCCLFCVVCQDRIVFWYCFQHFRFWTHLGVYGWTLLMNQTQGQKQTSLTSKLIDTSLFDKDYSWNSEG